MLSLTNNIGELIEMMDRLVMQTEQMDAYKAIVNLMVEQLAAEKKILVAGNGGSMADGMHFAEELVGNFRRKRRPLAALALSDPTAMSCISNDFSFQEVFSRQVEALGNSGDVLFLLSTSGESANLLRAATEANRSGVFVVSLTGETESSLSKLSSITLSVGKSAWADRSQEVQKVVIHSLVQDIERALNLDS